MANGGESTRIRHLIWKPLVATSCPPTIPIPKAPNSLLLPLFLIQPRSPTYSPSDWFLYSLGDGSQEVTSFQTTPPGKVELTSKYKQQQGHPQQTPVAACAISNAIL